MIMLDYHFDNVAAATAATADDDGDDGYNDDDGDYDVKEIT